MSRGGAGPRANTDLNYLQNYRLGGTLGIGTFCKVKVAEHLLTRHRVAIKIIHRRRIREENMGEKVKREIKILQLFTHPHVIRLYEVIQTPSKFFVVMEHVEYGELFEYIVENGRLQEKEARRLFQQIISGVEYCHRNRVVHRDLKPENLLLDSDLNVKIADFGLSNIMRDGHFLKTTCGSPNYAAPEVVSGKWYPGPEIDVWSCGVILYALLCGSLPFDDENMTNLYNKIKGGIYTLPSYLSTGARDIISLMLLVDPVKRITIPEIRQHPWFLLHLPRYLAVPPPDTNQLAQNIDDDILQAIVDAGFDENQLVESLRNRVQNQATVAYYIMLDNRRRISNGYLLEDFQEGLAGVPMRRPGAPGSSSHRPGLSPSGFQRRVQVGPNWVLGLQSRASRGEIMMDVLRALRDLEISWKYLGQYCLKCRWVPPVAASRTRTPNSDSPMVSGSLGSLLNSPMLSGSLPPGKEIHRRGTVSDGSGSSEYSQGGEEHNTVKLLVQLYKVRDERYLLDLQKVEGPYILFLDLCVSFRTELRII